ncbi:hypothetical protein CC86DRAFT_382388 [Ophiobolus disseminans]|uniref:Uncharacterized protein n=1 Tax=Ophiobolus disseminans TaxID=1469910 RepID=A0A6A6ZZ50_9PLEO|nr:hypothetical protein CC86DRAFT_382388 [Ophiobolus disseminans]
MALVTRILLHKHSKQPTEEMHLTDGSVEQPHQLSYISNAWKRLFSPKQSHVKGVWVPTISSMIKAGDEGLFPSALFANLHEHTGELSLQGLYAVFAEELRSRPITERSAYPGEIPRFLSTTKRVASGPKRAQSMAHRRASQGQVNGSLRLQRKSLDLSAAEKGLSRTISMKKPAPTLVSMWNGLSRLNKEMDAQTSWAKDGQVAESRYDSIAVNVTPAELATLSIILGCSLTAGEKSEYDSSHKGAFNISISSCVTEDGKYQVTLRQHKRSTLHMLAKGSGFSPLYAKHFVAGSLPYLQDRKGVHSILVSAHTLKAIQTGSPLYLHNSSFKTKQSRYLTSLPSSREPNFHIISTSTNSQSWNPLIDAIGALPFVGGLVPLASSPLVQTIHCIASGGLPPARLLQRLEGLVDKVNRQAPHLDIFGPLHGPHNAALLYRERKRLGKLAKGVKVNDSIADKAARMQRYITLLERLMALVPDVKPHDVLAAVQNATKKELERSYSDAVTAYRNIPSRSSSVVDSHGCPESDARSKRNSIHSHTSGHRSHRSSTSSIVTFASPVSSGDSQELNLGKAVEQILKAELPISIENIATVARMVIVAWTLSVETVAWEDGEEGFRVPALEKLPEKMVMC